MRLSVRIGFLLVRLIEKIIGAASLIGDRPLYEASEFPWVGQLEENWESIREELLAVLEDPESLPNFQDISTDQVSITQDDKWKTFFFFAYGLTSERNCRLCPVTARVAGSIPGMQTAFFSILSGGKHIPAHRGAWKGVLRVHLGLIIPDPPSRCRIRIHDQTREWREGEVLIFDDTYEHEVWNDSTDQRVVLFLDVERPLRWPVSAFNKFVIWAISRSSYIQKAKDNHERWERRQRS
jgi:beta-hydroxylase